MTMFSRVLLCYDGSEIGRRALKRGAELAVKLEAHVSVLAIIPSSALDPAVIAGAAGYTCIVDTEQEKYKKLLDASIVWLKERGVSADGYLCSGDPVDQITAYTKLLGIELIVLGHYPQPSGGYWWSGQKRASLAEQTKCCVFVAVDGPAQAS
jgi:nucleotide-binding universal stress UspA family protein